MKSRSEDFQCNEHKAIQPAHLASSCLVRFRFLPTLHWWTFLRKQKQEAHSCSYNKYHFSLSLYLVFMGEKSHKVWRDLGFRVYLLYLRSPLPILELKSFSQSDIKELHTESWIFPIEIFLKRCNLRAVGLKSFWNLTQVVRSIEGVSSRNFLATSNRYAQGGLYLRIL